MSNRGSRSREPRSSGRAHRVVRLACRRSVRARWRCPPARSPRAPRRRTPSRRAASRAGGLDEAGAPAASPNGLSPGRGAGRGPAGGGPEAVGRWSRPGRAARCRTPSAWPATWPAPRRPRTAPAVPWASPRRPATPTGTAPPRAVAGQAQRRTGRPGPAPRRSAPSTPRRSPTLTEPCDNSPDNASTHESASRRTTSATRGARIDGASPCSARPARSRSVRGCATPSSPSPGDLMRRGCRSRPAPASPVKGDGVGWGDGSRCPTFGDAKDRPTIVLQPSPRGVPALEHHADGYQDVLLLTGGRGARRRVGLS